MCRYVVQRRSSVPGGGDAAAGPRSSDRGLALRELRVPAAGWAQGVGAGQREARVPHQTGEMGRISDL
ncbi:hypothetical protein F7725_026629, partial [Dissostichus mawsoni]